MNQVTIVGNLTADPELRYTGSGLPVVDFTIGVSRAEYRDGALQNITDGFFRCVGFRRLAENVAKSMKKGNRVIVAGKLVQRKFEDAEGNKRSTIEMQVSHVGPDLQFQSASVGPRASAATESDSTEVGPSAATPADDKIPPSVGPRSSAATSAEEQAER